MLSLVLRGSLVFASLLVPGLLWAQAAGDTVHLRSGTPIRGTVTAVTPDEITVESPAGARQVAVADLKYIVFQDEPSELGAGRRDLMEHNYNQAFETLKKAATDASTREFIVQDVVFFRALAAARLAMGEGGDKAAAEKMMLDFVQRFKGGSSYHFYESADVLGDLAMSKGDYAAASKFYGAVINKAAKWPEFQMRATLKDGRALVAQKNYDEANKRFTAVVNAGLSGGDAESLKTMAEVGKATCDAETGKAAAAIKTLETIIEKNDPKDAELFALAYVALGKAFDKENKPKDAIMALLAVDLLYFRESEAHAEALSSLSKLWDKVGRADRALQARNTLKERYAGSVWATN